MMDDQTTRMTAQLHALIEGLATTLCSVLPPGAASPELLVHPIRDALQGRRFVDDLAELARLPAQTVGASLATVGLLPLDATAPKVSVQCSGFVAAPEGVRPFDGLSFFAACPAFSDAFGSPAKAAERVEAEWGQAVSRIRAGDPFLAYYRTGVLEYLARYKQEVSPELKRFVAQRFGTAGPKVLVTAGIGANEQFWHYPQRWHEARGGSCSWILCDNPKDIAKLPPDADPSSILLLEYSRSGQTQEIVKFDEFFCRATPRVVFANHGPLYDLGRRHGDSSLVLPFPDQIPGRFGKNLTPMLLAPLDLLGLPFESYWQEIQRCIDAWDLADPSSLPAALARYLRAAQLCHGANHLYLGTNDEILLGSCDELVQFWNEGVNKDGNDISMSRYFGLPRDSHLNIEGILSNHCTKAGLFVLRKGAVGAAQHPLVSRDPEFLNPAHAGLTVSDVDYALARANADRFAELMPTIVLEVEEADLATSARLSQLWTDVTYLYSLMVGVNPGSNPEVRHVRDRAEGLLERFAKGKRGA